MEPGYFTGMQLENKLPSRIQYCLYAGYFIAAASIFSNAYMTSLPAPFWLMLVSKAFLSWAFLAPGHMRKAIFPLVAILLTIYTILSYGYFWDLVTQLLSEKLWPIWLLDGVVLFVTDIPIQCYLLVSGRKKLFGSLVFVDIIVSLSYKWLF